VASSREYARAYYARNREKIRAQQALAYRRNPEPVKARAKAHPSGGKATPEKHREYQVAYQAQPHVRAQRASRQARRRAQAKGHVDRFRVWLLSLGTCGLCGKHVAYEDMHLDHIVPLVEGGEHTYENAQASHGRCNTSKGGGRHR
jgi:5-methylcytosine-specific restriction endonuclease McrA